MKYPTYAMSTVMVFIVSLFVLLLGWQLLGQSGPSSQQQAAAEGSWTLPQHRRTLVRESTGKELSATEASFSLPASTLKYFPQAGRCATGWMAQYTKLHADVQSGRLPPRYLVSVAVEAGLADRLAGLMTLFWHAVLTNRAISTVAYGDVPSFQAMCDAPFIDWTSRPDNLPDEAIEPLKLTYKGQRGYPGQNRSLPATLDPNTYQMLYLINGGQNLTVYQRGNVSTAVSPDPAYLLAATNRGRTFALATNSFHKQQFWEYGVNPQDAFMCGFFFMCSPAAAIQSYYQKYWEALQEPGVLKIGIQIRMGDGVFKSSEAERSPADTLKIGAEWFDCAQQLEKAYAAPGQKVLWYLNSDSQQLRKAAKTIYGDKLITDDELKMTHPDCHQDRPHGTNSSSPSAACQQAAMDEALQHSLGAMLTFSMTDYHVITAASGFGRLGAWLSGRWGNIYKVNPGKGTCRAGQPVPPDQSAYTWSGV